MPAAGPQNTRKAQQKRRKVKPKAPTPKPSTNAQTYVSQGKAVEKAANTQKRAAKVKRASAPYVSQGKTVERVANVQRKQTERQRKFGADRPRTHIREGAKRELEGRGALAKTLRKLAKNSVYSSTGGGPNVGIAAGRKATSGSFAPKGSAAITAPKVVPTKDAKAFGRAAQDFVNFPAVALPSVYEPAAAAVEAVRGHPERGKKLFKNFKKTDPVYNTAAAVVEKAKGNDAAAKVHLKRAGKAASEHPGFTALEVAGVKGTIGRGIGRVTKTPERAPATVEGTNLSEKREYSRDAIKRQRQKATDKIQTKRAQRIRTKAENATDEDAAALHRKANKIDPTKMTATQVRRRVDERVAANEDVRRINRTEVTRAVEEAVKPAKKGGAALSLVSQRIVRADRKDLEAYRNEIEGEFPSLSNAGKRANRELRRRIDAVLKDPKADLEQVQLAARKYERITAPIQKKLTDRGLLAEGQADKAKLIPYAVRKMGATHDPEKGLVVSKNRSRVVPAVKHETDPKAIEQAKARLKKADEAYAEASHDFAVEKQHVQSGQKLSRKLKGEGKSVPIEGRLVDATERLKRKEARVIEADAARKAARADVRKAEGGTTKVTTRREVAAEDVPLRPEVIRRHMRSSGEEEPAFLTQAPNMRGAKNFYIASDKAPSLRKARRTGQATRQGTFDAHPDTLKENAARAQGLADATDGFTNFIDEFGHRQGGKLRTFKTRKEAEAAVREAQATSEGRPTGALELRPVRINPWGGSNQQLQRLLDEVDSDSPTAHKAVADAINEAIKEGAQGDGPWALVPKAAADQLAKHMRVVGPGALGKTAQLVNSSFRKTVLSTSPSWLVGNVAEAVGRAAIAKAGPRSYITGSRTLKALKELDPEHGKQGSVRMVGGGHYSMAEKTVRRDHTQFEDTRLEGLARKAGALWRTPGPKQAAGAWHAWTDLVFHQINRRIETKFQTAMLGRAIRDSNLMDGQTLKTGQKAIEQAARGLRDTNEQVAFGRAVDRMYGKYNKFSPEGRMALALYTPFVAWTLNAVRFVYDVLPRDHPTVTALIAASEIATQEWRKDHGLDLFIENRVPAFLQGSIPLKDGKKFRASRYTPFGAFGSPIETATGAVLPQLSGVLAAGRGEDWKGAKLRVNGKEANEIQRWEFAAKAFAEATVPILSVGERVAAEGPKTLNPLKSVAPKKKVRRRSRASGFEDSGGGTWGDQTGGSWGG